jgi:hypothetical protein
MRKLLYLLDMSAFLVLSIMVISLTLFCARESYDHHILLTITKVLFSLGIIYELVSQAKEDLSFAHTKGLDPTKSAKTAAAVLFGTVAAFFVNIELGHGGVIGSSIVGLAAAVVLPSYAVPIFCGSFVGMASPAVFASYNQILLAGFLSALLFVFAQDLFKGFGGKLGTIAFVGSIAATYILDAQLVHLSIPPWEDNMLIIGFSVFGAVATFWIHTVLGHDAVTASSLVGLIAGLFLPALFGNPFGTTLAIIVFCASFIGMSTSERIPGWGFMIVTGMAAGLMFIYSIPFIGGAGGKLGTVAFASLLSITGLHKIYKRILRRT